MTPKLLTREQFVEAVSKRDDHRCVICGRRDTQLDAHHIIDRKLWDNGGYYLDNGALLCSEHHIQAEQTTLSCDDVRKAAGIEIILIPEHMAQSNGERYDKWGNEIKPTGVRFKGELFFDTGCQRSLSSANLLNLFTDEVKYPRTMHLPWSPNLQNDDKRITNLDAFQGQEVVYTLKMDGECTTMNPDRLYARSVDSKHHESRNWVKALHGAIRHEIPAGWRLCGENLYAKHSIAYRLHPNEVYQVFNIWDQSNTALSWDETIAYAGIIGSSETQGGLAVVKTLHRGIWDEKVAREIGDSLNPETEEGYVVRLAGRIHYSEWRRKAAKFVRSRHVSTDEHWTLKWEPNLITP